MTLGRHGGHNLVGRPSVGRELLHIRHRLQLGPTDGRQPHRHRDSRRFGSGDRKQQEQQHGELHLHRDSIALPDLAPYTPSGWSGPLVVSTESGNTISASTITTADTLYIDWAFINQGTVPINNAFGVELLLDGEEVQNVVRRHPARSELLYPYPGFRPGPALGRQPHCHCGRRLLESGEREQQEQQHGDLHLHSRTAAAARPRAYTPSGRSGPLVVSTEQGDTTTATTITTTSTIYIDWAFINQGNASIDTTFHTELLLDGKQVTTWYTNPPLGPTIYAFVTDFRLGLLTAGSHTVTVVANYLDEVTESDQTNNTESYTFTVTAPPPPAPTVNSIPNQTVTGGQSVMVTASATGPAGDSLQYGLVDIPRHGLRSTSRPASSRFNPPPA